LPGYPGVGCHEIESNEGRSKSTCGNPTPIIFQRKGDKGERGIPGVSLMGEKGEVGPQGN